MLIEGETIPRLRIAEVTQRSKSSNEFRLVCYNILAIMYSRTESARKVYFRHCPAPYLDHNYRYPLIYRELLAYQGDILCLQEVDTTHFQQRLSHYLQEAGGYEGRFISKLSIDASDAIEALPAVQPIETFERKNEGVAIFYKSDRFRLIREFKLDSLIMYAEASEDPYFKQLAAQYHQLAESKEVAMYLCMRARAHGALVCLFECSRTGCRFLCANAHLYFHPSATSLRNIQCLILRKCLLNKPLPIILAADLNTSPDSQPYKTLVAGPVNEDGSQQEPGPIFKAAIPLPEGVFTNIVPGFKSNLDAVLYGLTSDRAETLKVAHAFSVPTESEVLDEGRSVNPKHPPLLPEEEGGFTLPNSQFPSDHLPLIVDFAI
ncbi:unnamed protein product [Rodentolepis nana]|uniref:Endo/exonuclease/phosphatase domain-containing protein n=1 Tax=Rodentolepis nana TaxID=102285 RepID=A0A158QJ42_RODNA|nr:unnamed protein product [Rodentolepis nana]